MRKLFVAGCSISNRTQVTHSFGDFVAEELGMQFVNLAGGAGSNKRSIRLVVEQIRAGNLTSNDLLIFQWTQPSRTELHSPVMTFTEEGKKVVEQNKRSIQEKIDSIPEGHVGRIPCTNPIFDVVADQYVVTRFKPGSGQWLGSPRDSQYHTNHEELGIIDELSYYEMSVQYEMLEGYLNSKGIQFVSLWRRDYGDEIPAHIRTLFGVEVRRANDIVLDEIWEEYKDEHWHSPKGKKYWLDPDDSVHFSFEGHIEAAKHITRHLRSTGLV